MTSSKQTQTQVRNGPFTCVSEQTAFLTPSGLLVASKILNCFYDWPAPAQSRAELSQHDTLSFNFSQTQAFLLTRPTTTFYGVQGLNIQLGTRFIVEWWLSLWTQTARFEFSTVPRKREIFWSSGLNILSGPLLLVSGIRLLLPSSHSPSQISGKLGGSWHRSMMSMDKSVGNGASEPHIYLS